MRVHEKRVVPLANRLSGDSDSPHQTEEHAEDCGATHKTTLSSGDNRLDRGTAKLLVRVSSTTSPWAWTAKTRTLVCILALSWGSGPIQTNIVPRLPAGCKVLSGSWGVGQRRPSGRLWAFAPGYATAWSVPYRDSQSDASLMLVVGVYGDVAVRVGSLDTPTSR